MGDLLETADKTTCPWGCADVVYHGPTWEEPGWIVVADDDPYCGSRLIRYCPFCGGYLAGRGAESDQEQEGEGDKK